VLLQPLERLHWVRVGGIRGGKGVATEEGADGVEEEDDVLNGVVSLHLLVKV
jgi:hypothetical protein